MDVKVGSEAQSIEFNSWFRTSFIPRSSEGSDTTTDTTTGGGLAGSSLTLTGNDGEVLNRLSCNTDVVSVFVIAGDAVENDKYMSWGKWPEDTIPEANVFGCDTDFGVSGFSGKAHGGRSETKNANKDYEKATECDFPRNSYGHKKLL